MLKGSANLKYIANITFKNKVVIKILSHKYKLNFKFINMTSPSFPNPLMQMFAEIRSPRHQNPKPGSGQIYKLSTTRKAKRDLRFSLLLHLGIEALCIQTQGSKAHELTILTYATGRRYRLKTVQPGTEFLEDWMHIQFTVLSLECIKY